MYSFAIPQLPNEGNYGPRDQVIFFARARKITSCTFIARSIAAFE